MRALGRLLQITGLVLLPLAMFMELADGSAQRFELRDMLMMLAFGACAFYLGRIVEGYSQPP